jgi:hypothetical protein
MEKIKITQEVKDALEELLEMCGQDRAKAADEYFEMRYHWEEHGSSSESLMPLVDFGTDNFIKALYYGYEVEKLLSLFNE